MWYILALRNERSTTQQDQKNVRDLTGDMASSIKYSKITATFCKKPNEIIKDLRRKHKTKQKNREMYLNTRRYSKIQGKHDRSEAKCAHEIAPNLQKAQKKSQEPRTKRTELWKPHRALKKSGTCQRPPRRIWLECQIHQNHGKIEQNQVKITDKKEWKQHIGTWKENSGTLWDIPAASWKRTECYQNPMKCGKVHPKYSII